MPYKNSTQRTEQSRRWRAQNPKRDKELKKNWLKNNPEKRKLAIRKYYKKNKQTLLDKQNSYRSKNKEQCNNYPSKKRYYLNHKDDFQVRNRENHLKRKYNLTIESFKQLLKKQKGKCAVCEKIPLKNLHVDHNHENGQIRGLLCYNCNVGLGFFKDDTVLLSKAINYLNNL